MGRIIGIDLGDTKLRIAYCDDRGTPHLLSDTAGHTSFPSMSSCQQGGGIHGGFDTELFGIPENTVVNPMTIAGLGHEDLQELNRRH